MRVLVASCCLGPIYSYPPSGRCISTSGLFGTSENDPYTAPYCTLESIIWEGHLIYIRLKGDDKSIECTQVTG